MYEMEKAPAQSINRTYEEIAQSIAGYQRNISHKTEQGFGLAQDIQESVEEGKFQKQQMYELFIAKMQGVYKSELRFKSKQKKKMQVQKNASLYSMTPLKDILRSYNEMTTRGFNSELVQETLQNLNNAVRARGFRPRVMGDYSQTELEQSWRLQKVIDDIIFGLKADQFYSPVHLAQTSNLLAELGYKNTELIPKIFNKLRTLLEERYTGKKEEQTLSFEQAVYGGPSGFVPRHYVFKGFENSVEFNSHLKILLEWEGSKKTRHQSQKDLDRDAKDLLRAMKDTIDAAVQVKELQKDFQSTIENVRTQYFMMQEAMDKHAFLQENEYIRYDLLELQEMLVKGGFLDPDEANKHLASEPFDNKMDRAAQVFYDYVINYAPELISPQHNNFYEAAVKSMKDNSEQDVNAQNYMEETHNIVNLATLSETLVGLQKQALSYRRDIVREDYLNKFYEQYLMPIENHPKPKEIEMITQETVLMDRSYLRAWKIFREESDKLLPYLTDLVEQEKDQINGQLHALNALAACKFDQPELRNQIVQNCLNILKEKKEKINSNAVKEGLMGLAQSSSLDENAKTLARTIASQVSAKKYKFSEQIDVLWSLCALEQYNCNAVQSIVQVLNNINFERLDHDLRYDEFNKIIDIINALTLEAPKSKQITNPTILAGFTGKELYRGFRFGESLANYDPFKRRVVDALASGLSHASISHQVIIQNELLNEQKMDSKLLKPDQYPYTPDVVMGYKGSKLGVFVLPEINVMRDTQKADGEQRFKMRLLEKASKGEIQAISISVPNVVKYDIEAFKVEINKSFNFTKEIESQAQLNNAQNCPDFKDLSDFGLKFITQGGHFSESLPTQRDVNNIDAFVQKLVQIFQTKQQVDLRFETEQRNAGHDELRFQLMKLSLMHEGLSKQTQEYLQKCLPSTFGSFKDLLLNTVAQIKHEDNDDNSKAYIPEALDSSWIGTRLEVELPNLNHQQQLQKSIVPEMINQRFMWVEDYFHYDDWKAKQQSAFDNFNLLVVPPVKDGNKFFFDQDNYHRRTPQGVFPFPNHKRQILQPHAQKFALEIQKTQGAHDDLVLFEKEPYKMMVLNELKKAEALKPIDNEISMITNLQNIKQGLKADYSDREILNMILLNLNFTDQLIDEHLGVKSTEKEGADTITLNRDEGVYRRFVESTYNSKDREDPFTHFYLKEGALKESLKHEISVANQTEEDIEFQTPNPKVIEEGKKKREKLWDKVDKVLLDQHIKNEDILNISSSLSQNVKVKYDMNSLVKSEFVYDMDPELIDKDLTDHQYMNIAKRRAESKLIKMKIIYKMNQDNLELTPKEKQYLKHWINDIQNSEERNLLNLRDSLLPSNQTKLGMKDIDAKDYYSLNSISKVQLDRDMHGQYSLNELVLELSHFLDEEVVNKVETEIFSDRLRKEWGLSKDFKVIETRNKEISLVLNELEELAYRSAGMFNEKDLENVKRMISVKRNKDMFDKQFYENDMISYRHFLESVNSYDDRIKLLERWIIRKEDEIKERVVMPPPNLKKPDHEIFAEIDKPLKAAREKLVSQLLSADEFGNPIKKDYKDLTSKELNIISENISIRLYLFNYEYPTFLPQMVKAVMEHPNLLKSDSDLIDTYCKMFELDWKSDMNMENRTQFMFQNPIYVDGHNIKSYGEITNEKVQEKMRKACVPYVEHTTEKLLKQKL